MFIDAKIKNLFIYPIKSFRGLSLSRVEVQSSGFNLDRKFMLIDEVQKKFITLREHPELAKIALELIENKIQLEFDGKTVTFDMNDLGKEIQTSVWNDVVDARKIKSAETNAFLSDFLSKKVQLVSSNEQRAGRELKFQDSLPVHIINLRSVQDLAQKCEKSIGVDRFRSNIILDGIDAYLEDEISEIKFTNGLHLRKIKKTNRCKIIGTDQKSGAVDLTLLHYLAKNRREGRGAVFGVDFDVIHPGSISCGDKPDIS